MLLSTDFVVLVQKPTHAERSRSADLRGMTYSSVPKLSPTTLSSGAWTYPHFKIAPVILMNTLLVTCEDTPFQKLPVALGLACGVI